ncbi:MAG: NAD-reducing hydrogenase HoxS subunit beta [Acidimicrobiales bacterium]|nr:MAG: Ni/Fe hydrogenase subunit alpha [Actinomycetota bacterium]MBV6510487.1 NAD-reducing hydrogenase HoxS subunit beta [Acidimicrobiales bacterium]RIK07158.1 MAG: Ni/Fe hydrogenase subunit alpha [Acidobacteriota bacterium]
MTHRAQPSRTLEVGALARVEGEGAMYVQTTDGRVTDVQLRIYEPPRFFEAFLRGRRFTEPVDITARICGICPVAYQMSACRAIEDACGVEVDGPLRDLRRLLYFGEWIESHTLHVYMLHAPDFLGYESAIEMAKDHRETVEKGLELKRIGNELLELIGGRAVHPINVRVGGFYRVPSRRELRAFRGRMERARDLALETIQLVAGFDFPDFEQDYIFVALRHPTEYPILDGRLVSNRGLDITAGEFDDHFIEEHLAHSTALHAHLLDGNHYFVGPLARYNLNADHLPAPVAEAAVEAGLDGSCNNPFRSIIVRAVEVLYACHGALEVIDGYEEPDRPAVEVDAVAATGHGFTEAPRGILYHRYSLDGEGVITDARIVPPTSQNQATIEHDLWHFVESHLELDQDALTRSCEQAIRNYDPCISCSAHFLDLVVDHR